MKSLLASLLILSATLALSQTETILYNFPGGHNGAAPDSGLIFDNSGNLYGTTFVGGGKGLGTVFKLRRDQSGAWLETVLYRFKRIPDGAHPSGTLVFDPAGNLYGTTPGGGLHRAGTVFRLIPRRPGTWKKEIIYNFTGHSDGAGPNGGLIVDSLGNLYGTASGGGIENGGTVFKLSPAPSGPWSLEVLYSFTFGPGNGSYAGLVMDEKGNLYGTTFRGGANGGGIAFQLSPNPIGGWTQATIHDFADIFQNNGDGSEPVTPFVLDAQGNLYGTTLVGGAYQKGAVVKLSPNPDGSWTESVIYSFLSGTDGYLPYSGLALDPTGNLYGTTRFGGGAGKCVYMKLEYCGTVFRLSPGPRGGWTETVLHGFSGRPDGALPTSGVVLDAEGNIFGVAPGGETKRGIAFQIAP
jgi:uncharacterized repeat protein (TIGR03803 family)